MSLILPERFVELPAGASADPLVREHARMVQRNFEALARQVGSSASNYEINVLDAPYNAVRNDPSAAAMNANATAFALAFSNGAHTEMVYVPAGDYYFNTPIDMTNSERMRGAGHQATRLIQTVAANAVVHLSGAGCYLADMELGHSVALNMATTLRPDGCGIRIGQLQDRSVIQRIHFVNNVAPIYCKEPPPGSADPDTFVMSSTIRDCRAIGFTEAAIYLSNAGSGGSTGLLIDNFYAINTTFGYTCESGFYFQGLTGSHFRQLNMEGMTASWGIQINTCRSLTLESIHFETFTPNANYGALLYVANNLGRSVRFQGVTYQYSTINAATAPNYCLLRVDLAPSVELEGVVVEDITLVGAPNLFKFYGSPLGEGAAIYSRRVSAGPFTQKFLSGPTTPTLRLDEDKIEYSPYSRFSEIQLGGASGSSAMYVDGNQVSIDKRIEAGLTTEPANAPVDKARYYTVKNANGKMELRGKGPAGASTRIWTEGMSWPPPIVTALPASPVDGEEVYFQVGAATDGILWHFQYVSALSSLYKWVYLGGRALHKHMPTNVTETFPGAFANHAIAQNPTLTVPLAGTYLLGFGWGIEYLGAVPASQAYLYVIVSATAAILTGNVQHSMPANQFTSPSMNCDGIIVAAGGSVALAVAANDGAANAWRHRDRHLMVTPRQVG